MKGWSPARMVAAATLLGATATLALRYFAVAGEAATYNEAVYIELARHPWRSSYYPDTVFVRHPPLFFLVFAPWQALTHEAWPRLPGLLFSTAALALAAAAAHHRAGPWAAALTATTMGASFLVWAYAIQATMYPLALLLVALGLFAYVRHQPRLEAAAWTLLALTHLFGFVFLAARMYRRRHVWRAEAAWAWPAFAWLVLAVPIGMLNPGAGVIRLGPVGQGLRTFGTASEWLTGMAPVHVGSVLMVALALAAWSWPAWRDRSLWPGIGLPVLALAAYILVGAPFGRYGLFLLPAVAVAGTCAVVQIGDRRQAVFGIVAALLSVPAGFWYVAEGLDPRDDAEVPGILAWDHVAPLVAGLDVQTSAPPALALALEPYGWSVQDRSQGPWILDLTDGVETMRLLRIDDPEEVGPDVAVVPAAWGLPACHTTGGLSILGTCPEP